MRFVVLSAINCCADFGVSNKVASSPDLCGPQVLADMFSEVGPIKRAFVVREKSGESKGYGFVEL
jgi:hypothetical protein